MKVLWDGKYPWIETGLYPVDFGRYRRLAETIVMTGEGVLTSGLTYDTVFRNYAISGRRLSEKAAQASGRVAKSAKRNWA
jgi:hypothetical protein